MKRIAATLVMVAGLLVAPRATAASGLTVSGPTVGRFWSTVTAHGTGTPGTRIAVYTRPIEKQKPTKHYVTAGSNGAFSWTFTLSRTTHYWAATQTQHSAVRTVSVVQASCSTLGAAFPALPFTGHSEPGERRTQYAAFTANRGPNWGGYAVDVPTGDFKVLRWAADDRLRVLDEFRYSGSLSPTYYGNVAVAGLTPDGDVVAAVRDPSEASSLHYLGLYWDRGVRHSLERKPNWVAAWPVRVLDDGTIMGVARRTDNLRVLVSWASVTATPQFLMNLSHEAPVLAIDTSGDAAWGGPSGAHVRFRTGAVRSLTRPNGWAAQVSPVAAGRYSVYAQVPSEGVDVWDFEHVPAGGTVAGIARSGWDGGNAYPTAASRHGDVVIGLANAQHLRTGPGAWVTLPTQPDAYGFPGQAFDDHGRMAYTSAADGLPHFLRCD